jgi:hypothetical protein
MATVKGPSRIFLARFKNDKKKYIHIEPFKVETTHDFGKIKKPPSAAVKRMNKIATAVLDKYEDTCHKTIMDMDKKITGIVGKAKASKNAAKDLPKAEAEAEKIASTTIAMVKKAAAAVQGAIEQEVQKALAKEKNFAELLLEYKIKVVYKITKETVKVTINVLKLVGTGGADLSAWKGLVTSAVAIGKVVKDASKGEKAVRKDMDGAIATHTKNLWKEDAYVKKDKKSLKDKAKHYWRKHKKTGETAAAKLKRYDVYIGQLFRNVNKAGSDVDGAWKKLDKQIAAMPGGFNNPKAKKAVASMGPAIMTMKRNLKAMGGMLEDKMAYADDMAMLLTEQGVAVDRDSFQKKWRDGRATKDLLAISKDAFSTAKSIKTLAEEIGKLV